MYTLAVNAPATQCQRVCVVQLYCAQCVSLLFDMAAELEHEVFHACSHSMYKASDCVAIAFHVLYLNLMSGRTFANKNGFGAYIQL